MSQDLKYKLVIDWIHQEIQKMHLHPGDKFYSENEICSILDISRPTIRQAISILEQEHLLERRHGSGTFLARRPPTLHTKTIGVIATGLEPGNLCHCLQHMEQVFSAQGYHLQLAFTHNRLEHEAEALHTMAQLPVDGLLVEPAKSGCPHPDLSYYREIQEKYIPLLFFGTYHASLPFPHICYDHLAAGRIATEYLLKQGHQQIAGFFPFEHLHGHQQYTGYLQALAAGGISSQNQHVLWYTPKDREELICNPERIIRRLHGCTALICSSGTLAAYIQAIFQSAHIPDGFSIVSITASEATPACYPSMTTMIHTVAPIGTMAAKQLLRMLEDPSLYATIELPLPAYVNESAPPSDI